MRFINGGFASSREAITEKFLPDILSYYEEYDNLGFWAIVEKSSREFIGWVVLRPESRFRIAVLLNVVESDAMELGYRLRKVSWGKGYVTEASQALIDRALEENIPKIIAWALPENKASIRVMEKLGMKLQQEYVLTAADVLPNVKLLGKSRNSKYTRSGEIVKYKIRVTSLITSQRINSLSQTKSLFQ